ncbi:hypothetical protein BH11MYX1_BH11MYX1_36960 [soil metagenome]
MRELRKRPEGWRTLRVHELELWWHAGAPRVTAEGMTQRITIAVAIERADGSGKQLRVTLRGTRPFQIGGPASFELQPETIRSCVERAAPKGAWPTGTGTITLEHDL